MADLRSRAFRRQGNVLVPDDFMAEEWLGDYPEGAVIDVIGHKSRSEKTHRHFFAVLNFARKHLEAYQGDDDLLDAVKVACGHVRPVQRMVGRTSEDEVAAQHLADIREDILDLASSDQIDALDFAIKKLRTEVQIMWLPKSISDGAMDAAEFGRFKARAFYVLDQLCGFSVIDAFDAEIKARERRRSER